MKTASEAVIYTTGVFTPMCIGFCACVDDISWSQIFSNMGHVLSAGITVAAVAGCLWLIADRVILKTEDDYREYIRICRDFFRR